MERDRSQDVIPYRVQDARDYGLNAAIILAQLRYWLKRTNNVRDDRQWIFKSYRQWAEETGLTPKQARNGCNVLRAVRVVDATPQYNDPRKGSPLTLWYTLNDDHLPQRANGSDTPSAPEGRASAPEGKVIEITTKTRGTKTTSSPSARASSFEPSPEQVEEALSAAGLVEVPDPDEESP